MRYLSDLEEHSAADLLCAGLVEATGYGVNREPARALAARLPAAALRTVVPDGPLMTQALLLGSAGLLPSQRGRDSDGEASELETGWRELQRLVPEAMAAADWRFHGIRPASYPPRRLAGVALLLAATPPDRLLADAARALRTAAPRQAARSLASALCVAPGDGYWRRHWDFGRPSARPLPALVGPDRAAEIIVNVLLPLLAAWGEVLDDAALTRAAHACYREHPPTGDNERLRHMRQQILGAAAGRDILRTACRQQGLLHIHAQTCGWRRCAACVVGPRPAAGRQPVR
jgi:hypothetical protein